MSMSLYGDYIVEDETGFATYRFLSDQKAVYIVDLYTVPGARGDGRASALADRVAAEAKELGFTSMIGTVAPSAKGSTRSLRVLLAYGMDLESAGPDYIVMKKEI